MKYHGDSINDRIAFYGAVQQHDREVADLAYASPSIFFKERNAGAELSFHERQFKWAIKNLDAALADKREWERAAAKAAEEAAAAAAEAAGTTDMVSVGSTSINWECIHQHEAAWNDPGAPYYGGLQMGDWFMGNYAPDLLAAKGTADHWTPGEQVAVAEGAWDQEGHSIDWLHGQWPRSSRSCGY